MNQGILVGVISGLTSLVVALQSMLAGMPANYSLGAVTEAPTSGLVGYWNFDEGSGTTATDNSGNGNNAALSGGTWTTGKVGAGALSFNGTSDEVTISGGPTITKTATIAGWFYWDSSDSSGLSLIRDNTTGGGWILAYSRSGYLAFRAGGAYFTTSVSLTPYFNKWTHYALVRDGSNATFYLDGQQVYTGSTFGITTNVLPWHIMRDGAGTSYLKGTVDEVRIYNRALSATEISDIYNAGSSSGTSASAADTSTSSDSTTSTTDTSSSASDSTSNSNTTTTTNTTTNTNTTTTTNTNTTVADTAAPSTPSGLTATAVSSSKINLSWSASTDNTAVTGYKVFKNGNQIVTVTGLSYSDTGLSAATAYVYTVAAFDAAGNLSSQSTSASATTQAVVQTSVSSSPTGNGVTITDLSGTAQNNRPFTISRVFVEGEFPSGTYPKAVVNGTPTLTQVDVKNTWADGSLKHALVSFLASVPASGSISVEFGNQSTTNNSGYLSQSELVSFNGGNWGAKISAAASGITKTVDAKSMLGAMPVSTDINNSQNRYWMRGPIVTQVIVEDKTTARAYDFGWSCASNCSGDYSSATWSDDTTYRSLHPIFVLTFYPSTKQVKEEYIIENVWSKATQDQRYSVNFLNGSSGSGTVYSNSGLTQYQKTRWHENGWDGVAPGPVKIDYNLPYMSESKAIPNYDTSLTVTTSKGVAGELSRWKTSDKGVPFGDWLSGSSHMSGFLMKSMNATGARAEIGLFPTWITRYLYTFHTTADGNDLYNIMLGNADVSGYMPLHLRSSDTNTSIKYCALSQECIKNGFSSIAAFGHIRSRDAYPQGGEVSSPAASSGSHNWNVNWEHMPSLTYVPYLITGDWYYGEELSFLAAQTLFTGGSGTQNWQAHDDWAYITRLGGIRSTAWSLRNIGEAAFAAPDNTPEKNYFTQKVLNNIAIREGTFGITDGYGYSNDKTKWQWGYTEGSGVQSGSATHAPNPLNIPSYDRDASIAPADSTVTKYVSSPWMLGYFEIVLGHLEELGFPITKYKEAVYKMPINIVLNPVNNPYWISDYRMPAVSLATGNWFQTYQEFANAYSATEKTRSTWWSGCCDVEGGYDYIAYAAAQFWDGTSDGSYSGTAARKWVTSHVTVSAMNENPKWAFAPRTTTTAVSNTSSGSSSNTSTNTTATNTTTTTTTTTTTPSNTTAVSTKFVSGQKVQTTSNLNVRASASASGTLLGTQSLGSLGTIVSGGISADGYYWWYVNYDSGADGYSVENYLQNYIAPASSGSATNTETSSTATNNTTSSNTTTSSMNSSETSASSSASSSSSSASNSNTSELVTTSESSGGSGGGSSGGSSGSKTAVKSSASTETSNTSVYSGSAITKNVALGTRGSDVSTLQNFLISKGYLSSDSNTGYFGYQTQTAVQKFQKDNGIVSSGDPNSTGYGAVGPKTKAVINSMLSSTTTSSVSEESLKNQIKILQAIVNELMLELQTAQKQAQ